MESSVRGARRDAPMKPTLSRLRCGFPLWVLTEILGCTHKIGRRVPVAEIVYLYPLCPKRKDRRCGHRP